MDTPKKVVHRPLPELLVPGKWTVIDGKTPHVDRPEKVLEAPHDEKATSQQSRLHELAHVRWSPVEVKVEGVEEQYVLAAEEARIHAKMGAAGVPLDAKYFAGWRAEKLVEEWEDMLPSQRVMLRAAAMGTADEELVDQLLNLTDPHAARHIDHAFNQFMQRRRGTWLTTVEFAEYLQRYAEELDSAAAQMAGIEDGDEWDDEKVRELGRQYDDRRWGKMHIQQPPLTVSLPAKLLTRKTVSIEDGVYMRRPERWATDKKIFGMKFRRKGKASVLIDISGSMSLSEHQIKEIVEAMPGSIIAMYSGEDFEGNLIIIANKGRRVGNLAELRMEAPGGNVIDGPALRWLAKQDQPRYWICDGVVTGVHDMVGANLSNEAADLARKHRIRRIPDITGVLARAKEDGIIK